MYRKRLMIDEGERSARPPNATGQRSSVLRRAHAVATDDVVKFHLQKLLELLDGQASVTNDRCHLCRHPQDYFSVSQRAVVLST